MKCRIAIILILYIINIVIYFIISKWAIHLIDTATSSIEIILFISSSIFTSYTLFLIYSDLLLHTLKSEKIVGKSEKVLSTLLLSGLIIVLGNFLSGITCTDLSQSLELSKIYIIFITGGGCFSTQILYYLFISEITNGLFQKYF